MSKLPLFTFVLGVALLVVPATAWGATTWQKNCQAGAWNETNSLGASKFACTNPTAIGESEILFVNDCENIDILFGNDLAGGAAGSEVQIFSCLNPTDASGDDPPDAGWSPTGVCWIIENTTMDGVAGSEEAIYGVGAIWIYVNTSTYGATDTPRVGVRCNR